MSHNGYDPADRQAKVGKGGGRQGTARAAARAEGDIAKARALAPPSERVLTDDERCGARTGSGGSCRSRKGSRTDHPGYGNCSMHGGNTDAGIKSAMREMGRDLSKKFKAEHSRFGGNRHDPSIATLTPEQALLEEVRRSAAFVRFLEERIGQWNLSSAQEDFVEKFVSAKPQKAPSMKRHIEQMFADLEQTDPDSPHYLPPLTEIHPKTGITSFTDAREWLLLYREERGQLARVAKMCIDAGVAQRLVSIAEDQGRILASAIRTVLTALNLTPEQAALVPRIVPPVLRAVATDSPIPDMGQLVLGEVVSNG